MTRRRRLPSELRPAEGGPGVEGANGDPVTEEETTAILAAHRLAAIWPPTLKLVSMGGGLYVIHSADERFHDPDNPVRAEAILDTIHGIPNDGGDW
jgi:hypothetical protein